jgi:hypothetical protein
VQGKEAPTNTIKAKGGVVNKNEVAAQFVGKNLTIVGGMGLLDKIFQKMVDFYDYPHQSTFSRHLQKFIVPTAKKIGEVNVSLMTRNELESYETRDFLWGKFRPGNRYSGQGAKGFLRECLKNSLRG